MTTIIWDGKYLVGDKCSWSNGLRRRVTKVFKIEKRKGTILAGFCGRGDFVQSTVDWLSEKTDDFGIFFPYPDHKEFDIPVGDQFGLVIKADGSAWQLSPTLIYTLMEDDFNVIGAGQEIAIGALEAGANAIEAMEIVQRRSDYAALGYDVTFGDD